MHIIVCIKQVPDTTNIRINPETNTLMREGVESILNPFDEFALELALDLKEHGGARVSVLTMGPPQAEAVLREALARGADDAVLLSDHAFAGSDTWATSYTLAQAIKKINPKVDLILFGKQAIDGDTAQVGPGVSEFLALPLVTFATSVTLNGENFVAETMMDEGVDLIEGTLPVVVTVSKGAAIPRFASLSGWMNASAAVIPVWSATNIAADPAMTGLDGSPTRVKEIFAPQARGGGVRIDAVNDPAAAIDEILKALEW
ncbi:MAG: electron transfer flavoprotein subunit beta/FixA family protein [Kiritimatiellae bacterium]|jgi:electron transfer flavoprotein alpha/beta subunit|nr:electron transfer flavoprotein subunit beta/FixA family protein [Kiritimatiellia bacterium]